MAEREPSGLDGEIISRLKAIQGAIGLQGEAPRIPLIDPTANVLSLVTAAITRQDDLRLAEAQRVDDLRKQQIAYEAEIQKVREKAQQDLTLAESNRINATMLAESRRIDALLAAATSNVALASEKAATQAATLAASVVSSAEAMRTQVAATSAATTTLITQLRESLEKRVTLVEQNQYQGVGETTQRGTSRQQNQWIVGIIIGAFLAVAEIASRFWGK
jgi:hypothetical protein